LLYLYSNPWPLRRFTFHELGLLALSSRRRWRFERLFCRLRLRHWLKKERRLQHIRHVRSCRGRGQGRGQRATRAGQRAARSEEQKQKPTPANAPAKRFPKFYRKIPGTSHAVSHQNPQFYVQPSSGFCWIPPVVRRLLNRGTSLGLLVCGANQVLLLCRYFALSGFAPKSVWTRESPLNLALRLATAGLKLAAAMMTRIQGGFYFSEGSTLKPL
jgi:hypothetical protein